MAFTLRGRHGLNALELAEEVLLSEHDIAILRCMEELLVCLLAFLKKQKVAVTVSFAIKLLLQEFHLSTTRHFYLEACQGPTPYTVYTLISSQDVIRQRYTTSCGFLGFGRCSRTRYV